MQNEKRRLAAGLPQVVAILVKSVSFCPLWYAGKSIVSREARVRPEVTTRVRLSFSCVHASDIIRLRAQASSLSGSRDVVEHRSSCFVQPGWSFLCS